MSHAATQVRKQRRSARFMGGPLGLSLLSLTACQGSGGSEGLAIQVSVNGLGPDVSSLAVRAASSTTSPCSLTETTVTTDLSSFTLTLPGTATGTIEVQAAALNSQGDSVGWDKSEVNLGGGPGSATLMMRPPIDQGMLTAIWGSGGGCASGPGGGSDLYIGGKALALSDDALVLKQRGRGWSTFGLLGGSDPIFSLWGSGPNDLWAVAAQTFHYDGSGWSYISDPGSAGPLYKVWGSSANDVWAVGDRMIHWNGTAWSLIFPANGSDRLGGLWGSSADDVWAVGATNVALTPAGLIRHWDGKTWNNIPSAGAAGLSAVWGSGPTDVWAVGGGIVHWDGTAWTAVSYPGSPGLSDVWGSGPSDVWAVGTDTSGSSSQGVLLHWDGTAWTSASPPSSAGLTAIWGSAADDVWVTGTQGIYTPVLLHWDGASWSRQPFLASP